MIEVSKDIRFIGVDPGLTKTGLCIVDFTIYNIQNEKCTAFGENSINLDIGVDLNGIKLSQFVLSNYILLLNLQNLAKDLIKNTDPAKYLSCISSKKLKKTKKESAFDAALLRLFECSKFLINMELSELSITEITKIIRYDARFYNIFDAFSTDSTDMSFDLYKTYILLYEKYFGYVCSDTAILSTDTAFFIDYEKTLALIPDTIAQKKVREFLPKHIYHNTIYTKTSEMTHKRLQKLYDGVQSAVDNYHPSHMVLEEVFVNAANPMSALKLGGARGVISLVAANKNLRLIEISAGKIKQKISFNWHGEKGDMKSNIFRIVGMHNNSRCSLDASDSIAGAICGFLEHWHQTDINN